MVLKSYIKKILFEFKIKIALVDIYFMYVSGNSWYLHHISLAIFIPSVIWAVLLDFQSYFTTLKKQKNSSKKQPKTIKS